MAIEISRERLPVGRWKKAMKELWRMVMRPIAFAYCSAEYLFLIACRYRALRRAEYVYPLWFWSFGHQSVDLHMLAMRFRGKKMLVLLSDYQNFNSYIVDSFREHIDICFLRHSFCMRKARSLLKVLKLWKLKFTLLRFVLRATGSKAQVVEYFHERFGSLLEGIYTTEYIELLHSDKSPTIIEPLAPPINAFRQLLDATPGSAPGDWWVSFYFRRKGKDDDMKNTDPQTYRLAMEYILALGGRVFCGGDYDPRTTFPDMPSLCGYHTFPCDRTLTDYFFLTHCRFFVGGHSGPLAVANMSNIPALITNCPRYYISGYRSNQRVLFKHLMDRETGLPISAQRTFSLPVIAFVRPEQFADAGLVFCENSPKEILAGVEEMVELVLRKRDGASADDRALEQRFRSLLPRESAVYRTPCRPAIHYLRSLHFE